MADIQGISIEPQERFVVFGIAEDAANSDVFSALREHLAADTDNVERHVFIDLSQVSMIPSMVLGDLVQIKNVLTPKRRRMMLVGLKPDLRRVFALTKLDRLFEMHDTLDEASAHLPAPK